MEAFKKYLKQKGYSRSSQESYLQIASMFIEWAESRNMDKEYITYAELMEYLKHLKKRQLRSQTTQHYIIGVRHYFDHLKKEGIIESNPASYVDIQAKQTRKLYPTLNKDQLENLYQRFDIKGMRNTKPSARASAIRNRIATGLMVYQGLDVTALSTLLKEDVNILDGTIIIRANRLGNRRILALQAKQIIELDRYISQTRKELQTYFKKEDSDLLLIHGFSEYRDAHKSVMRRLRRLEPELLVSHQIRASVITHWLKQHNLREVQYMAGHRKVYSTELYQQNDTESLQRDIDRFHPMR